MIKRLSCSPLVKAQLSAFIGGVSDYFIMFCLVEFFGIHYTLAIVIGGSIGAAVNFLLNRKWSFTVKGTVYKASYSQQIFRFVPVVVGSIFLKSLGTFLVTTYIQTNYKISRLIIEPAVSLGYNYVLQKHWVFQKKAV